MHTFYTQLKLCKDYFMFRKRFINVLLKMDCSYETNVETNNVKLTIYFYTASNEKYQSFVVSYFCYMFLIKYLCFFSLFLCTLIETSSQARYRNNKEIIFPYCSSLFELIFNNSKFKSKRESRIPIFVRSRIMTCFT